MGTYEQHPHFVILFVLNFDTLCSLKFLILVVEVTRSDALCSLKVLILVFEVTRSDEDTIEHGKIMR
jgi:hypothetical protein